MFAVFPGLGAFEILEVGMSAAKELVRSSGLTFGGLGGVGM